MTKTKAMWEGYFLGISTALLSHLLLQDYLGQDGYVDLAKNSWVDLPWWPWALFLILAGKRLFNRLKEAKKP